MFRTGASRKILAIVLATAAGGVARADDPPPVNVYLAAADLSADELAAFIAAMREKPASLQRRPGFQEAIVEAADRLLEVAEQSSKPQTLAIVARFQALHILAEQGDTEADTLLDEFATALEKDKRPAVAREAGFHRLRKRVAESEKLEDDEAKKLLADLEKFMEIEPLEGRHILLASGTVGVINRLKDDEAAAEAYRTFGALFAKSSDRELAAYGKKIAKGPPQKPPSKSDSQPDD